MWKIKKSESTGTCSADVYIPKWNFFLECSFLEDVITCISNRPSLKNISSASSSSSVCDDDALIGLMENHSILVVCLSHFHQEN